MLDPEVSRNLKRSAAGQIWTNALPAVVDGLREMWGLRSIGHPYAGGSHSLVCPVDLDDGSTAVLKVPLLDDENRLEADALRIYAGDGTVTLLSHDLESGAMLLERAIPGNPLDQHPDRLEAIAICCGLLCQARRKPPPDHAFTLVTEASSRWRDKLLGIISTYDGNPAQGLFMQGAEIADRFSRDPEASVLVNRDAHLGNILAAQRRPYLLIDPKPLVGEPAFDAGYLLDWLIGDDYSDRHVKQMLEAVASGLRVDEVRAANWGFLRAMENAVWALSENADSTAYIDTATALGPFLT